MAYQTLAEFIADRNLQCGYCKTRQLAVVEANALKGPFAIRCFECLHCKLTNIDVAQQRMEAQGPESLRRLIKSVDFLFRWPGTFRRSTSSVVRRSFFVSSASTCVMASSRANRCSSTSRSPV